MTRLTAGRPPGAVCPPLVINREQVDELVDMLDQAIGRLERDLNLA